jgi:hypothetical protein
MASKWVKLPDGDKGTIMPDNRQWLYDPSKTRTCTDALFRFITEYSKTVDLFMFTVTTAARMDQMQAIAAHALAGEDERKKDIKEFNKGNVSKRVREFSHQLSRNLVTSMANNFNCYLSELLQEVMLKKHAVLRSNENVTTAEVLQFTKMADVRSLLVDRKLTELSYGGLRQIRTFISDRLGVEMFETEDQERLLTVFLELRNIHTHNRGIINQLFLNRAGKLQHDDFNFTKGQLYHVSFDEFVLLSRNSIDVALGLDQKIANKFKIKRTLYKRRRAKEPKEIAN